MKDTIFIIAIVFGLIMIGFGIGIIFTEVKTDSEYTPTSFHDIDCGSLARGIDWELSREKVNTNAVLKDMGEFLTKCVEVNYVKSAN